MHRRPRSDDVDDDMQLPSNWRCIGGGWALALRSLRGTLLATGVQKAIDMCAPDLATRVATADDAPDMYDGCEVPYVCFSSGTHLVLPGPLQNTLSLHGGRLKCCRTR